MNSCLHENAIALCMEISEKNASTKPLTNAEFYELSAAIDRYNGNDKSSIQMNLFEPDNKLKQRMDFAYLREVDVDFLSQELGLKNDLPKRIIMLLSRMGSLAFEIERLEHQAIKVCTVFDDNYPEKLKSGLKSMPNFLREPPILYYCGDLSLAKLNFVGFVGSRDINNDDKSWVREAIEKIHAKAERENRNMGVVSGGAEGVDSVSEDTAIDLSMPVIEYSKNMRATLKNPKYVDAVMNEGMLLMSEVNPLRNLSRAESTSHFMGRNKYIYATADYTIVAKSAIGPKSGTWVGASEALKRKIGKVFVQNIDCAGNRDLIRLGARPLTTSQD